MNKCLALSAAAFLLAADQLIKRWVLAALAPGGSMPVIPKLFSLTYVENRGAAFGIMQGRTDFLSVVSGTVLLLVLLAILTNRIKGTFLIWTASIGMAGGAGNLYDRLTRGFVVDYLDFSAVFGFPVFNLADCCVVCAAALIFIYVIRLEQAAARKKSARPQGEA